MIPTTSGDEKELENAIVVLLLELHVLLPEVNITKDKNEILGTYLSAKRQNSLSVKFSDIASEWHPTKNTPLTPDNIDFGSGLQCYWICSKCGYEFKSTPNSRTRRGAGCPVCGHRIAWSGHTDIETLYPELMKEWDYEKNNEIGLIPSELLPASEKKAYWICSYGHTWKASIGNRVKGKGCPTCAMNKRCIPVVNVETGETFSSIKEAGAKYNIQPGHIGDCCKGRRKTIGGYHWKFAESK